jgi:arabinofuranan 3-O-arabinosyltransferase
MTATTGTVGRARSSASEAAKRARDWRNLMTIAVPALIAYVPLLLTHPGMVGADTKTYLYLDPIKLLKDAPYVWDAQIGLGTVTHQNIGYLFPMGPFYLFFDKIGAPDWVAQRLWLGTVLFSAAMGVRYLLRTLGRTEVAPLPAAADRAGPGWRAFGPWAVLVASLSYMLSPYILDYSARISVILLPWCALPWLIALAAKSVRHGGWKYPAWFAFVVLLVGGINATALIMVALGPLLWVAHAVWIDKEATGRQAVAAMARMGALTLLTSLWWIAGLWAEGRFGLPVIRYTESYRTVAEVSNAPEVLRGLGYWFFYGNDKLGPWIEPSEDFTTHTWLLGLSYLLPILAFTAAALVRWRYRAYFIALILFGGLTAVASHPWKAPSIFGLVFKEFTKTDSGLSLRSTPRAVPLVILATAVFLGAGVDALGRRLPRFAVPIAIGTCALIMANMPPMWNNTMVASNLERPEAVPSYWSDDAAYLDSRGQDTRVLEIPGAEFASYRWGNTVDPILPGMMERPYVARELFTWGSPPSANLINALDRRYHEDTMDREALAPIARLMAIGDVNVRSDMQYERYRIARPKALWQLIRSTPGLGAPAEFGPTDPPNIAGPVQTMIDEVEQSTPPDLPEPPRVAAFPVTDPLPILRTETAEQPLLMAADGEGLVDAASQDLVNPRQAIFYSASLAKDQASFDRIYEANADLMLTDTNRKRARRWGSLRENTGYTERAGETPLSFDPSDQRLDVFPGAGDDAYAVTEQRAVPGSSANATVTATGYGNPITYTPDDRPANALDGDPQTAWRVGAISDVANEKLFIDLDRAVTTDHLNLLQPINLERTRWMTKIKMTFDRGTPNEWSTEVDMQDISRDESGVGQDVTFPSRTFQNVTFEVLESNLGPRPLFDGVSGVGFAEVRIPGVNIEELVRMPTDLLTKAGESSLAHNLTLLMTRMRSNPEEPVRTDEEVAIRRAFALPTARTFSVGGTARVSGYLHDDKIDAILGMPDAAHGGVTAKADVHLPGNNEQRASAAIDGDPATHWSSIYQKQIGHWLEYTTATPVTVDHFDMSVVADGRHSIPTQLEIQVDDNPAETVLVPDVQDLPLVEGRPQLDKTVDVPLKLNTPRTGTKVKITIKAVREVKTAEWYSDTMTITPVAIAELGIPGLHLDKPGPTFDSGCRDDLLAVNGAPVPLRITGTTEDAVTKEALAVAACPPREVVAPKGASPTTGAAATGAPAPGAAANAPGAAPATKPAIDATAGIPMPAGENVVRTGIGRDLGIDLDRLAFASAPGGAALPLDQLPSQVPAPPPTTVDATGRVDAKLTVTDATKPFWLVQGQSWNPGWRAAVNGTDLGPPVTINGYANGWYVDPAVTGTGPLSLTIVWTPQKLVWIFIGVSIVGFLVCLALMLFGRRRREALVLVEEPGRPLAPVFAPPWPWQRRSASADPSLDAEDAAEAAPAGARPAPPVGVRTALVTSVLFGLFVFFDVPTQWFFPLLGIPMGLLLYVALRRGDPRRWLGLAGAASLAVAGAYFVIQQRRNRYNPNFIWPTLHERVHIFGLLAMFFLAASAVHELVTRGRAGSEGMPAAEPPGARTIRSGTAGSRSTSARGARLDPSRVPDDASEPREPTEPSDTSTPRSEQEPRTCT